MEKPVTVHACTELAGGQNPLMAMGGTLEFFNSSGGSDSNLCSWLTDGFGRLDVNIARRSNSDDFRTAWEEDSIDASEISAVDWSPDGELRVVTKQGKAVATLWALIINTDYVNRHVYIEVTSLPIGDDDGVPQAPPIETQKISILELGKQLSDAIRAAQPPGVILPDVPG